MVAFVVVLIDEAFEDEGLSTDETFAQDPEVEGSEADDFGEVDDAGKTDNAGGVGVAEAGPRKIGFNREAIP